MAISIPRAHSVTQMMPADGWFFRFEAAGKLNMLRLAAWGLDHDGLIVGMVPASTADFDYPHLVMVPSNQGSYIHIDNLTPNEQQLINPRRLDAVKNILKDAGIPSVG
ncbi:hypothetical protein RF663_18685 [Aeromonas veronii]|uniref:hypothetical protein n=1 Tax=Aeromonas veronii TaxID=654 RepID=UPI002853229B|nr:hypothetical protein [Aeromonas veronii]MDR5016244.1 hypothetical protein [Aeromonas veronii]